MKLPLLELLGWMFIGWLIGLIAAIFLEVKILHFSLYIVLLGWTIGGIIAGILAVTLRNKDAKKKAD